MYTHTCRVFSKAVHSYALVGTCVVLDSLLFLNRRTCEVTDRQILCVPSLTSDCGEGASTRLHRQTHRETEVIGECQGKNLKREPEKTELFEV